jgi:hypothetical protein
MYKKAFYPVLALLLLFSASAYSQQDDVNNELLKNLRVSTSTDAVDDKIINQPISDYKIIASNNSYIEIEFNPFYHKGEKINYNGQEYTIISFENAIQYGLGYVGQPDLRMRAFPVIFPSMNNNTITVTDYEINNFKGVTIAPVANIKFRDPNKRDFTNFERVYDKNEKIYSANKFFPEKIAEISNIGVVRDLLQGTVVIHPVQYNPVTGEVRQYMRIRVRITFGQAPVMLNKPRTRQENFLLGGIGINSDIALNWMNPALLNYKFQLPTNSVMTTGDWYRIEIKDNGTGNSEGMYKLTKTFLEGAGINFSGMDPRTIKMYGNGGYLLSEDFNLPRPGDLQEMKIYIEGENDGSFDANDYILFYGRSVHNWTYDTTSGYYSHYLNYYTNSNYYWICVNTPNNGIRMNLVPSQNSPNPIVPTSTLEKLFYEPEVNNLLNEGNLWLSERKGNGQAFTWGNTLTGLEDNSDIFYRLRVASRVLGPYTGYCPWNIYFLLREEYSTMSDIRLNMECVYPGFEQWIDAKLTQFTLNSSQKTNGNQSLLKATFYHDAPDGDGYFDWMEIQYKRRLNSYSGDAARFNSINAQGTVEYNVGNFSNTSVRVFDVTNHNDVFMIQPVSITTDDVKFRVDQQQNSIRKFSVNGLNGYKVPAGISQKFANQNYRNGFTEGASLMIITHKDFMAAAQRLKQKREEGGPSNPKYIKTYIFETEKIYNEFSGGLLDPVALRDFVKLAYETWAIKPVYVCLFGDGDLDYKNILNNNTNWVPPFEKTDPEIHQVLGYTSDDFFVNVSGTFYDPPDLAVGRIPCSSLDEAHGYVDKLDCYENPEYDGYWKNRCVYVADDGITTGGPEGTVHTDQTEDLAENHTPLWFEKIKLYLVLYPTVISAQGRRKPDVNKAIIKNWNDGCLMLNYTGHGSPDVWAHEYVLEKDQVMSQLNNYCKYNFVTIASCDFSKFDNPQIVSGGELFVIHPRKGSIGTFAATRPVYSGLNAMLNNHLWDSLLFRRDTLLLQNTFGAALWHAKLAMDTYSDNERKFVLMGDPSLRVQQPRYRSRIDSIAGLSNDTMRALSRIKIYGTVMNPDSSWWNDYNGKIFLKIFDVTRNIQLVDEYGQIFNFKLNGGIIFSGIQNVVNGKWLVEFVVPKDISYLNQNGKLINYFYSTTKGDGSSIYTNFIVGGIDPNAPADTVGPRISLYLNTRNFRSGDMVNPDFKLVADLFDESGINTTGTIGHRIEAILDNDETNKFDVTNFYNSDTSYKYGSLEYDFNGISEGKHTLSLKAWDTYNNSSEVSIDFVVSSSGILQVMNVYNFPNPFKNSTWFTFQHNYPDPINVKIKIYTVAGRLIKEINNQGINDKFVAINWSGKDEDGETLGNGIYIYSLTVEAGNGQTLTTTSKLAVLK